MEQREFEDFLKNWQKIVKDFGEAMSKVSVISKEITKVIEGSMIGLKLEMEPIQTYWVEYERNFVGIMDSMRRNIEVVNKARANLFRIPEAMAENIRGFSEDLTKSMKPIAKFLRDWKDITKSW